MPEALPLSKEPPLILGTILVSGGESSSLMALIVPPRQNARLWRRNILYREGSSFRIRSIRGRGFTSVTSLDKDLRLEGILPFQKVGLSR